MRRHIYQLALLVTTLATSLYGQPNQDFTDQTQQFPVTRDTDRTTTDGSFMNRRGRPDFEAVFTIKDFTNDKSAVIFDNGLVFHPVDRSAADIMHNTFKPGDKVAVRFSVLGLFVKPIGHDKAVRMTVWDVPTHSDLTVKGADGRVFQLSDNTTWEMGFFASRRVMDDLRTGLPIIPITIQSTGTPGRHAIFFFTDGQGRPRHFAATLITQGGGVDTSTLPQSEPAQQ